MENRKEEMCIRDRYRVTSTGSSVSSTNCLCEITEIESSRVLARILPELVEDTELPVEVTLYQGLPKGDKLSLIHI